MSSIFTPSPTGDTPSALSKTPPPTQLSPATGSENSDLERTFSLHSDSVELHRQHRSSRDHNVDRSIEDEDLSSQDGEKENMAPISQIGTRSKSYTDEEEKEIVRKLDKRLVLFMALLYMLSFLDRSNIGNARIAGLDTSLSLTSTQYSWLLTAFYITYIAFEWMTLLYRVVPPHIYISLCVFAWGLIASLQSVATSFLSLAILRALLGVAEAAFGPGVPFYLTFFYKRSELAYRVGLFISAAPLATTFASSLAWLIVKIGEKGPLEPWRALLLVEGFPSVIVAIFAWYQIPDSPATIRYFTPRQRKVAKLRLQSETEAGLNQSHKGSRSINSKEILTTLLDPKAYLTALMFFSANVSFSSLPVFLPTIIKEMSFSTLTSQALSAPPFLVAFGFVLLISYLSDRTPNSRALFIILVSLLSSISYTTIALAGHFHSSFGARATLLIRYFGVYGAAMGFFSAITLIITWTLNNQHSPTGKGTGMTILNVIGQCGPLVGVKLFPKGDGPYYVRGMAVCAGFMLGVAVLAAGLTWDLKRRNRRLEEEGGYEMVEMEEEEGELMGSGKRKADEDSAREGSFRFML